MARADSPFRLFLDVNPVDGTYDVVDQYGDVHGRFSSIQPALDLVSGRFPVNSLVWAVVAAGCVGALILTAFRRR
jgi:hypothetical protein